MPRYNKRRYKRKRGRKSFGFRVAKQAALLDQGKRKYIHEERNDSIIAPQNQAHFEAIDCGGTYNNIQTILGSSMTGALYTDLGDHEIFTVSSKLAYSGASVNRVQKYDLSKYSRVFKFRNITEHAQMVTIYEIQAKIDKCFDSTADSMSKDIVQTIAEGWEHYYPTGDAATTVHVEGDKLWSFSAGNTHIDTPSDVLKPSMSRAFNNAYKTLKKVTYKLMPGDEIHWPVRFRDRVYNPKRWHNSDMTLTTDKSLDMKAGYSKALLIRLCGCLGRSETADEADVIGFLQADLAYTSVTRCGVLPMVSGYPETHHDLDRDDLTTVAKTMMAPTDHSHLDEDD
jgi:hypothetical protein